MTVTEVKGSLGTWDFTLKDTCPRDLWDRITYFGHVFVFPSRLDPAQYGDNLLPYAHYGGVVRKRGLSGDDRRTNIVEQGYTIAGPGMEMWLGDEDDKGDLHETAVDLTDATFPDAIRALLPPNGAVTEGTLYDVPGQTYGGRHQYETPRKAIQYVCETVSASGGPVGWRVNPDGTLDAGPETDLYVTDPKCVIVRKDSGEDLTLRGVPGQFAVTSDMEDLSTRVVLLAEGDGESIATATADMDPGDNPYKDVHGNALRLTRMVSESDTTVQNADARAELALGQYSEAHVEATLETDDYWIEGAYRVGDYVWVYDPEAGLYDTSNEIIFRGQRLNPMKLQIVEARWPLSEGYMVAYRDRDGAWFDLTDHMEWDNSETVYVTVGGIGRALVTAGTQPIGSRPSADTSTPGVPTLTEPFLGSAYLDARGFTRSRTVISWEAPNNEDGSTVIDGHHFEIRWGVDADMIYPATWSQISQVRWQDLQTWAQPFAAPDNGWQYMNVAWGESVAQLNDLSPGVGYDVQIRAVDKTGNIGEWSPTTTFVAAEDNLPPSTPAPPSVASSRIAVQVTHELGKASGGVFNLERDLHHLEVHVHYEPHFTPDEDTLKAKVSATAGMIQAGIPVVATVLVEETTERYVRVIAVDITGNKSGPSDAASATALLIDDTHISDLSVTKVTAGTVEASWVLAGEIKTADTGARARVSGDGFELYNAGGTRTFFADADTGDVSIIGTLSSGTAGTRIVVNPTGAPTPEIRFYPTEGADYARISSWDTGLVDGDDASIMMRTSPNVGIHPEGVYSMVGMDPSGATFGRYTYVAGSGYFAQGGFVRAQESELVLGHFDRLGTADYGGYFHATATQARIGYLGTSANENRIDFDNDGVTRHYGAWYNQAESIGYAIIDPGGTNQGPVSVTLTGLGPVAGSTFFGYVTAVTTVPGSINGGTVSGVACTDVTATAITVWMNRSSDVNTTINWMIRGVP